MSSDILWILPVLHYAEREAEKTTINPSEDLCDVLARHMQNYAALINPGLTLSPSMDSGIFPDQYDVADANKHLYSTTEWTNSAWQNFRSYLNKPLSFQLPVSKASELLGTGQKEEGEDMDDDVYICLSSPEEVQASSVNMDLEDTFLESPVNSRLSVDGFSANADTDIDLTSLPQNVPHDCEAEHAPKDSESSDMTVLIKKDPLEKNLLNLPISADLPAELIVSITSANRTVTDESLGSVISTVSATKHNDFELSGFSAVKLKTEGVNILKDETVKMGNGGCTNLTKTRWGKVYKKAAKAVTKRPSVQTVKVHVEDNLSKSQKDDLDKEASDHLQLSKPSGINWRKLPRQKRKFGKLSATLRSSMLGVVSDPRQQSTVTTMELEACTTRKKNEHLDLKPVVSECGRILVPHGSVDFTDQIKYLKDKLLEQTTNDKRTAEKMLDVNIPNTCMNLCDTSVHSTGEMEQDTSTAPEMVEDRTTSKDRLNHLQTTMVGDNNPENVLAGQLDGDDGSLLLHPESSEQSSENDGKEVFSSEASNGNDIDRLFLGNGRAKSELLLCKLKSVLFRGKRNGDALVSEGVTGDTAQDMEASVKKGKFDSDTKALKSNNAGSCLPSSDEEPSEMLSLDPHFAYALGLTPKEKPVKVQNTETQDSQLRKDLPEKQELLVLDKQPQIIYKPPSIFQRRSRIKTLKNHQSAPAGHIKRKCKCYFLDLHLSLTLMLSVKSLDSCA